MVSPKFDALAAKVGSTRLAGWITQHNPKVRARAMATRARKKGERSAFDMVRDSKKSEY